MRAARKLPTARARRPRAVDREYPAHHQRARPSLAATNSRKPSASSTRSFAVAFQSLFGGGHGEMRLSEPDSSGEAGHRHRRAAARQAPAKYSAALGRRKSAHGARAADRGLPLPAQPVLHPRRSRRAARRSQRRPLQQPARGHVRPDAVHRRHPQSQDHGNGFGALRRDHAGARRLQARFRTMGRCRIGVRREGRRRGQQRRIALKSLSSCLPRHRRGAERAIGFSSSRSHGGTRSRRISLILFR